MANVPGLSALGKPLAAESAWQAAGGGYVQRFENGWAMIGSNGYLGSTRGTGGTVTGAILSYLSSHSWNNIVGWPKGNAVTDSFGTWQQFDKAAVMTSGAGTYRLQGGMYAYYVNSNLRSTLGSLTGEEARWSSSGGGWAQHFANGWMTYQSSATKGYILNTVTPFPVGFPQGWPKSGTYAQCGAYKVDATSGYYATDGRWCPAKGYLQPVNSVPGVTTGTLTYHAPDTRGGIGDGGLKVWLFQQRADLAGRFSAIDATTRTALQEFQRSNHLSITGALDTATWNAMATGLPWNVDGRTPAVTAPQSSSRSAHISAMLQYARGMVSKPYIYGAGDLAYGADCSGLALQALHAAGLNPSVTMLNNIYYPMFLAEALWKSTGMERTQTADSNKLQAGDLAFYTNGTFNSDGSAHISHVAVVTRSGYAIDAENVSIQTKERSLSEISQNAGKLVGYLRPFTTR